MDRCKMLSRSLAAALAAASTLALAGCGPKTPAGPASVSAVAAPASDAASDVAASPAASDAIAAAARPAAGTVSNAKGDNQKTIKPSATLAEQAQAGGDEAPAELRAKVAAAKAAGRAAGSPQPKP
ncbi:MAG: hypothetical protein JWO72_1854 [Caulobacteraceae bacterium]|nr:hypothetical protein [Caulobacteraceae bacterium]